MRNSRRTYVRICFVAVPTALAVMLTLADHALAADLASTIASLPDTKAECAYLQARCSEARAAKREAQQAMSESRANHQRSRALLGAGDDEDTRTGVALQGRAVQEHLTAASRHRLEAAHALYEAVKLITAKRGRRPSCATCRGITD